jgi:hypothetical protein
MLQPCRDIRKGMTIERDGERMKIVGKRYAAGKDALPYDEPIYEFKVEGDRTLVVTAASWLEVPA